MSESNLNLPDWYPTWARKIAELYFSGTSCFFVVHGNVSDLVPCQDGAKTEFVSLTSFLGEYLFGRWDLVLKHNLSKGLQALAGRNSDRHQEMMRELTGLFGHYRNWSRKPDDILLTLDQMIDRYLLEDDPGKRKRLAVVFDYGQYLVPPGDPVQISGTIASRVVRFLDWARNPYIRRVNMAFVLVCENLSEVNERLTQNPYVSTIEVPMPDAAARSSFVSSRSQAFTSNSDDHLTDQQLVDRVGLRQHPLQHQSHGVGLVVATDDQADTAHGEDHTHPQMTTQPTLRPGPPERDDCPKQGRR